MYITLHKTQVNSSSNSTEYSLNLQTDPVNSIDYLPYLVSLQEMVFNLSNENLQHSIEQTMNVLDTNYPYSFNIVISILIYSAFVSRKSDIDLYLNYLEALENKEKEINENYKIIEIFINHICKMKSQETFYIIFHMNERNLIKEDISKLFNQFHTKGNTQYYNIFYDYYDKHSNNQMKNNNKLDDKLIKEGNNPNEIAKIIRNDEIEKLQEISSQTNFDFNQIIKPSPYERCSFVNEENVTLIDYAAFFSSVKCFKYLLVNGAKLESTGKYAIAGGNLEILHLCEQNHTLFENAYETAVKFHRNDIFHYLYENKMCKINEEKERQLRLNGSHGNNWGCGETHEMILFNQTLKKSVKVSIDYGNYSILSFLVEKGIKVDRSNDLIESANIGNVYLIKQFLPIPLLKLVLPNSAEPENMETLKYILENDGENINYLDSYTGLTALMNACKNDRIETVKFLLDQEGINVNVMDEWGSRNTALIWASAKCNVEIIKLLLKQEGIETNVKNKNGDSALILATKKNNEEIVQLLLEHEGIDTNICDGDGNMPLHIATEKCNIKIVKLLLNQKGTNVNAGNRDDISALMIAAIKGDIEIVQLLLDHNGINVNANNKERYTALMAATIKNNIGIVKLLLEQKGINVNQQDKDGMTALMMACGIGNIEIVKLLLEQKGIDVNINDWDGRTALTYASPNSEIVKLLEKHGAIKTKGENNKKNQMSKIFPRNQEINDLLPFSDKNISDIKSNDNGGKSHINAPRRQAKIDNVFMQKRNNVNESTNSTPNNRNTPVNGSRRIYHEHKLVKIIEESNNKEIKKDKIDISTQTNNRFVHKKTSPKIILFEKEVLNIKLPPKS